MEFGIFDHLDRNNLPLHEYYEERLKLIELYERAGFHSYHVAEHHSTPLGMAPSPSVFLAAVAQRTKRLRFGPLVYALPLYHPIRLIEEICMLDQMSAGRLDIGFGRGASQIEAGMYGNDPAKAEQMYVEGLEIITRGLTSKRLDFKGEFFKFDDVPMEIPPYQKPHPPIWYGVHSPISAERAARQGLNIVSLDPADKTRVFTDRFREVWREAQPADKKAPLVGLGRFIFVADTDEKAIAIARRAYPRWHQSFNYLFYLRGGKGPVHQRPAEYDKLREVGQGCAGSPATILKFVEEEMNQAGTNYLVGQFAFGDLSPAEYTNSMDLFIKEVMPQLRNQN